MKSVRRTPIAWYLWFPGPSRFAYFEYDGNRSTMTPAPYMRLMRNTLLCPHHPPDETGDPFFTFDRRPSTPNVNASSRHAPAASHEI